MSDPRRETIVDEAIGASARYQPEPDGWLDKSLERLWAAGEPEKGMEVLFGVCGRSPEQDGYGVF